MRSEVVSIHIARKKAQPTEELTVATLVAGRGIEGDRYFMKDGSFSAKSHGPDRDITLIELEALDAATRDYGVTISAAESRRNVLVKNVALNHLVGRTFKLGDDVVLKGIKLCEPCGHLAKLTSQENIAKALVHRGGLRATIVVGGTLRPGDRIEIVDE